MAPPQIHPCQVSTQTTPAPSMPGQHTDHPSSIHARSAHRPPHLHPCQVSTQTTPPPSTPGHHSDHPSSIHARSVQRHSRSINARSVQRHPRSIPARSALRPPHFHPCQVSTKTTPTLSIPGRYTDHPPPDFPTWGFGKGTENPEKLDFGGHWDLIIELPQD